MRKIRYVGWGVIFIAPWFGAYIFLPDQKIELTCQSTYEMLKISSGKEVSSFGTMTSYYHADGSGISRYAGMLQIGADSTPPQKFSVHRVSHFDYEFAGSFVRISSRESSKYIDDNADDAMVAEYVYPGFKSGSVEYFKILNVGGKAFAAGIRNMPRIYCEPAAS